MIRLRNVSLPSTAMTNLQNWQRLVDNKSSYEEQVAAAKRDFAQRNKKNNKTFQLVKAALVKMCSGARRCVYCEDSFADEVEHIKPKDLYPGEVFSWSNYVYACGPCNGPKNNKFAVISATTKTLVDVTRAPRAPIVAPETGEPALINPRWEDALKFIELDLVDTFFFLPSKSVGTKDYQRADYTIEVLRLNDREALRVARKEAYGSYVARLDQYIRRRDAGAPKKDLGRLVRALKRMQHPTVWKEIKRQHSYIPELNSLFAQAPEAKKW
ncbi:MAG TPA: HNH endonuclease [Pyrinomonadaceae bacterium]